MLFMCSCDAPIFRSGQCCVHVSSAASVSACYVWVNYENEVCGLSMLASRSTVRYWNTTVHTGNRTSTSGWLGFSHDKDEKRVVYTFVCVRLTDANCAQFHHSDTVGNRPDHVSLRHDGSDGRTQSILIKPSYINSSQQLNSLIDTILRNISAKQIWNFFYITLWFIYNLG